MRTTLNLDKDLMAELMTVTGAKTKVGAIHMAISEFVRQKKLEGLKALSGKIHLDLDGREMEDQELKAQAERARRWRGEAGNGCPHRSAPPRAGRSRPGRAAPGVPLVKRGRRDPFPSPIWPGSTSWPTAS